MYPYLYHACLSDLKQAPGLMGVLSAVAHDIPFTTDPTILAAIHEHDKLAGMSGYNCIYLFQLCLTIRRYMHVCAFVFAY